LNAVYAGRKVEVLYFFKGSGGRNMAIVKSNYLEFPAYTHGGWAYSQYANAPTDLITFEEDECHCKLPEEHCKCCEAKAREVCSNPEGDLPY